MSQYPTPLNPHVLWYMEAILTVSLSHVIIVLALFKALKIHFLNTLTIFPRIGLVSSCSTRWYMALSFALIAIYGPNHHLINFPMDVGSQGKSCI